MSISRFNGKFSSMEGKTPFLIGVAGGTASGKSTVCARIMEKLGQVDVDHTERKVVTISQDYFYRELTPAEKAKALKGQYNFDHPDAFNEELMLKTLQDILEGKKVTLPSYDYRTNSRSEIMETIYPADVVLFEGILVFYFPEIRNLFHMKLFVDTDSDTRLARRVPRDINERGRDLEQVLNQYMRFVKPAFEEFCLPTKKHADVIIPRGADNTERNSPNEDEYESSEETSVAEQCRFLVAIDLIVHHIWDILHGPDHPMDRFLQYYHRSSSSCSDTLSLAIDLIVQHIRDFLNNRAEISKSLAHSSPSKRVNSGDAPYGLH